MDSGVSKWMYDAYIYVNDITKEILLGTIIGKKTVPEGKKTVEQKCDQGNFT